MKETREQIDDLLSQLEQQMNQQDDVRGTTESQPEPQYYRLIDVHIYDYEQEPAEGAATIEGTIQEPEQEKASPRAAKTNTGYRKPIMLALVLLSLLLFEAVIGLYALPVVAPEATIVITPASRQIQMQTSITIGAGAGVVRGRALLLTMSQQQTIKTTGTAQREARSARGIITFYNAAPYAQTIPAGILISGAAGVQIVTETEAIIPAAVYPTFGQASVAAHAASPGAAGNTEAGAIYGPCCRLNISAVSSAFAGGTNARTYQTATKEEISTAVEQMKQKLEQSIEAAFKAQLTPEETVLAPSCTRTTKTDKQTGEEAAEIQITLEATCTSTSYNESQYKQAIAKLLNQQAHRELGEGYRLTGRLESEIVKVAPKGSTVEIQVKLTGAYSYRFTEVEQEQIKELVSGKSKTEAKEAVLRVRGVQAVSFSFKSDAATLPADSKQLSLVFLAF